jgi:SAM-dependent methyltransferase
MSWATTPLLVVLLFACARQPPHAPEAHEHRETPRAHQRAHSHSAQHEHLPPTPPTADHPFTGADRWSKIFDDPARDAWQKPRELVSELGLTSRSVVVDLGAGTGYFEPHLSRAVSEGRVIAVDVEPEMVSYVERRARREGLPNVVARLAAPDDAKIDAPVDVVLVVDTYHHIGDRIRYFARLREKLAQRGRVVVVDFRMGKRPVGPPESHKLPPEQVEREMILAGFRVCRSWDGLPHQYVLFFGIAC